MAKKKRSGMEILEQYSRLIVVSLVAYQVNMVLKRINTGAEVRRLNER